MASRDLTLLFVERRTAANLRRRSTSMDNQKVFHNSKGNNNNNNNTNNRRTKPFGMSKKTSLGSGDDHLLVEDGLSHHHDMNYPSSSIPNTNNSVPPRWVDDVDDIHKSLSEITRLMNVLSSLHASRLGSVFGNDLEQMEGEIESLTRDVTDRFRHAEGLLRKVGAATRVAGGEEATVGSNVQKSLAKKLQELSVDFRQKQRKYLKDVQIQKGGSVSENETKFGIDFHDEINHSLVGGGGGGNNQQQLAMVEDLSSAVVSRDSEIVKIAQSIEELGAIFKELAVLVIDQGTILDRIDYNMEAVVEHTKEGIVQLQKAETHQKSARPMKCILFLLSLIGILLMILVWKHRRRSRSW